MRLGVIRFSKMAVHAPFIHNNMNFMRSLNKFLVIRSWHNFQWYTRNANETMHTSKSMYETSINQLVVQHPLNNPFWAARYWCSFTINLVKRLRYKRMDGQTYQNEMIQFHSDDEKWSKRKNHTFWPSVFRTSII